jgi:hypothetical protein
LLGKAHSAAFSAGMEEQPVAISSRLCIKNIPKYADEKRLRDHFSAKGEVTDVKVMKTR